MYVCSTVEAERRKATDQISTGEYRKRKKEKEKKK